MKTVIYYFSGSTKGSVVKYLSKLKLSTMWCLLSVLPLANN